MDSLRWKRFAAILTISLLVPSTSKPGSSGGRASASPLFNFFGRNRDRQRGPICRRSDGQNRAGVNETLNQQPADTEPVVPIKAGSSNDHAQQGTREFGDDSLSGNIHECDLECGSSKGTDGSCNVSAGWCFGKGRKETSTDSCPPVAEAAAAIASANGKPAAQAEGVRLLRPSDARKRNAGGPKPAAYAYEAATASAHRAAPSFTPVPSAAAAAVKEVAAAAAAAAPLSAGIRGGTGGKGGSSSSSSSGCSGGGGEDAAAASDGAAAQQQGYYDGSAQEWEQQQQQQPAAAYEGGGAAGAYAGYEGDADGGYAALEAARQNAAAAGAVNPLDVDYAARVLDYALYHNGLMDDDMATPRIRFISALSCLKLSIIAAIGTAVAYASVSPRNAPREIYMQLFQRNLLLLGTSLVGPGLFMLTLHDSSKASANAVISAFFHAFTWGYLLTVLLELVLTTVYRMAVLQVMEPQAYSACPDVPAIWLPWVLRDHGYYLKPLTAFVANFAIFCLGTPWIEEAVKVWTTRWTGWLPKRPAALAGTPATLTAVHVHTYVVLIVAAAMGLKVADNARRILLYTRHTHRHKFLFALLRGFFPLQELCAALTAMSLARRDILGERVPAWRVYLPAAALHAWANFRGTAPIVKWSADAPWVELQMGAWSLPDGITAMQLLHRGLVSLLWFSILLKVLSYTIKTYWRLSRLHNSRLRRELFR